MRDAIVLSGWTWETFNVPERIAVALAALGSRVLYCENPVSLLRHGLQPITEIELGIHRFGAGILSPRLNRFRLLSRIQARMIVRQMLQHATRLQLHSPLFFYPHGNQILPICEEMKKQGFDLIHICMDYPEDHQSELIGISDATLVIPPAAIDEFQREFGAKLHLIPQPIRLPDRCRETNDEKHADLEGLAGIPRPRLGYLGEAEARLDLPLLRSILQARPDWHFVCFGKFKSFSQDNLHVLPWRNAECLPDLVADFDVGFMPYDFRIAKNVHCVPLKLFDYFAAGLPAVATSISYLRQFQDLVYLGDTPEELSRAILFALQEPVNSPKRIERQRITRDHSIESVSQRLRTILPLGERR